MPGFATRPAAEGVVGAGIDSTNPDNNLYGGEGPNDGQWGNTAIQVTPSSIPSAVSSIGINPNNVASATPTPPATSDASAKSNSNHNGGLSTTKKVAIAVPVAVGGAALIAAIVFLVLFMRRRKQRKTTGAGSGVAAQTPINSQVHIPKAHAHVQATPQMEMATAAAPVPPNNNNTWTMPSQTHNMNPPFDGPLPQQHNSTPVLPETYRSSDPGMGIGLALTPENPVPSPSPPSVGVVAEFPRARSPFNHPDDTLSDISRVSGRRRDIDGDGDADADGDRASVVSSVSSIDEREHERGHEHRGSGGH